jgi:CheY-like chemotaxis protein/glycine cleavage system H lipoate-binding protein
MVMKMTYRANVLVVDDEKIVCDSCRKILGGQGHNVQAVFNGRDALRKVEEDKYDVLIADWKMPDINGMEVLRIVKKNHPDIIVIMITGFPSVESAVTAMRLGVSNYVPKPLNPDDLTEALHKALEERSTGRNGRFYYQKYIWARMLENGNIEVGVNHTFRESMGDIMYVDLPCHQTRSEHGKLFIRILTADKQMHKLYVPIHGRVTEINHQINFKTDLINKDPMGKGWILRMEPSGLEEDLKSWSGNISAYHEKGSARLDSFANATAFDWELAPKTEVKMQKQPPPDVIQKEKEVGRRVGSMAGKFFLSALASRLFFVALLPLCLGSILKALFYQVSPQEG